MRSGRSAFNAYSERDSHTWTETAVTGQHRMVLGDMMNTGALVKGWGSSFADLTGNTTL